MDIAEVVVERWGLVGERVERLAGGMNSRTWLAVGDGLRVVVKAVDLGDSAFGFGLELAARVDAGGVGSGRPIRSTGGRLVEVVGDQQVAVLEYVEGVPLVGELPDHAAIGTTLGRVHVISERRPESVEKWFELVTQFDAYLDHESWVRPAVRGALNGVRELTGRQELAWAGLHGDPAPEAFLRRADGVIGLIDWGGAMPGPALYDLASALMYLGRQEELVGAYLAERPKAAAEIEAGLDAFLRFRQAVQAGYFAWRCSENVLTGISGSDENAKGLADARRFFEESQAV